MKTDNLALVQIENHKINRVTLTQSLIYQTENEVFTIRITTNYSNAERISLSVSASNSLVFGMMVGTNASFFPTGGSISSHANFFEAGANSENFSFMGEIQPPSVTEFFLGSENSDSAYNVKIAAFYQGDLHFSCNQL